MVAARVVASGLVVSGMAACTSSTGEPAPSSSRRPASTTAAATTPLPSPVLTPLDTLRCVVQRTLAPDEDGLFADSVRPAAAIGAETQGPVETVPGADAVRCPGSLPAGSRVCDEPRPWSRPADVRFFTASGATRRVEGALTWSLAGTPRPSQSAAAVRVIDLQSVGYGVLDLRAGDPAGALGYLERSALQCDSASRVTLGGRRALVGTVTSQYRQGPATLVLLPGSNAAAWLVFDGTTRISQAELTRIVAVAAARLLPS